MLLNIDMVSSKPVPTASPTFCQKGHIAPMRDLLTARSTCQYATFDQLDATAYMQGGAEAIPKTQGIQTRPPFI